MDKETVIDVLRSNRAQLKQFHVRSLAVFGSVVRGEAGPDSDIDILVEFEPGARVGLFTFARLQRSLQKMLGRPVDLVTPNGLHKALKEDILKEAIHAL